MDEKVFGRYGEINAVHQSIPYTSDLENGNDISKPVVHVILDGDQLTKQNADAAIGAKANEESSSERMEGLIPVIADFHCSMNFNDVIFKRFYNPSSQCDSGSLFHLRNVVHRTNVTKSALGDNYRPCNTFIQRHIHHCRCSPSFLLTRTGRHASIHANLFSFK